MIPPIAPISGLGGGLDAIKSAGSAGSTDAAGSGGGDSFSGVLGSALGKLDAGQHQASSSAQGLATGKASDISSVVLDVEHASLQLQLATQVRNKLVDAYQEIMRMQV